MFDQARMIGLIRLKRGSQGLRAIATELGISASTLSRIERGHTPDIETFARLCQWLEVSMDSLFNHAGQDAQTIHLDCKSPEGVTVGLIDSLMSIAGVLSERDLDTPAIQEALMDLAGDGDIRKLIGGE